MKFHPHSPVTMIELNTIINSHISSMPWVNKCQKYIVKQGTFSHNFQNEESEDVLRLCLIELNSYILQSV